MIADQGFINLSKPGHFINMKVLMNWFSEKVGMPIAQIDPLKIDVASVTSVVVQGGHNETQQSHAPGQRKAPLAPRFACQRGRTKATA